MVDIPYLLVEALSLVEIQCIGLLGEDEEVACGVNRGNQINNAAFTGELKIGV